MLEINTWLQSFVEQLTDPVFLCQDETVFFANHAAHELSNNFNLQFQDLFLLVQHQVAQHHTLTDGCYHCEILTRMSNHAIPLTLTTPGGKAVHYSLFYQLLDAPKQVFALELKNQESLYRAHELAQQKRLNQYVNRAHEEERKRIARDLHDSIAQGLYSARMGIQRIEHEQLASDQLQAIAELVETQLDDTLAEVKGMALEIRPSVLDSFGLVAALKALTKRLEENSGVSFVVITHLADTSLSDNVKSVLYRIAQEAISNALRHANALEITVLLVAHAHFIKLEIIDDGDGFEIKPGAQYNGHSMGLMNMNERIKALNGTFDIHSELGNGTTVSVQFPTIPFQKEAAK